MKYINKKIRVNLKRDWILIVYREVDTSLIIIDDAKHLSFVWVGSNNY